MLILGVVVFTSLLTAQEPPKPKLPVPTQLKLEELKQGNPLAQYVEMLRREPEYAADPMMKGLYYELRANIEQALGDPEASKRGLTAMYQGGVPESNKAVPYPNLDPMIRRGAAQAIAESAGDSRIVLIGEEHHAPQTRTLLLPLLRALKPKGFRYLAVETFADDVSKTQTQGYPTHETGTYTRDPVFSDAIREAVRLGHKLVPYEFVPQNNNTLSQGARQEARERGQAENIKKRIFDQDPSAKALIWGGRAHASIATEEFPDKTMVTMMGGHLKRLTGLDPFNVYAARLIEQEKPEYEAAVYQYVSAKGWLVDPTVFASSEGKLWSELPDFKAEVFFPRPKLVSGRPDWYMRDLGRSAVPITADKLTGKGLQLVQAFYEGEPATAIAIDQFLVHPGAKDVTLMLPQGKFWLRVLDETGADVSRWTVAI